MATDEAWEQLARRTASRCVFAELEAVNAATDRLARKLESGEELTSEDLARFRRSLRALQAVVEGEVTAVVDGTDPYERAFGHVPYGVFCDYLGVSLEQLAALEREGTR
ncbi:hypothetical protein [Halopiger djelfimassiliensis]|uniref:hypothetical protein n=1 Tax=Halopiger djelfimassiliensis TaxID=1293047 RepID=UPI000677EE4D|nr:hypothetical protein [Halopiger djelfimassiliensis]